MAEVVIALDVSSREAAWQLIDRLPPRARFFKVGLELFVRAGPSIVSELHSRGRRVFLDLKLHDIPNTVAAATRAASQLNAELLTVHAQGGPRMIEAARAAVEGWPTRVIAVTLLTSLVGTEGGTEPGAQRGEAEVDRDEQVVRLARLAIESGAHGVVASAMEAGLLRQALPREALIVTPGIRMPEDTPDDHVGVATPAEAARAGADVLVVGRSVTRAVDPGAAFERVTAELAGA